LQLFTAEKAKIAEKTMMKHFREKKKTEYSATSAVKNVAE